MKKYYRNHLLISFLVIFLLLLLPLLKFYSLKSANEIEKLKIQETNVLELQKTAIDKKLKVIIDDLLLLAEHVKIAGESGADYQYDAQELENLENEFLAFGIGKKRYYDQLRYLDENGRELVRINFTGDTVKTVERSELQDKSARYYFKDLVKLETDEIYISPFDLNVEHEQVELPYKPMLRIGTPLRDKDNKFKGALIINYLGEDILSTFDIYSPQSIGHNMLLNSRGFWLRNSYEPEAEWSFMFDSIHPVSFKDVFANDEASVFNQEKGQLISSKGILTFQTIYPIPKDDDYSVAMNEGARNIKVAPDEGRYWKLVSFLENAQIRAILKPLQNERNMFILVIVAVAMVFSLVVSKIRLNEIDARNNLRELNSKLEEKVASRTEKYLEAKLKAEENDKLKTAFLANMSHEIRTPMSGIMGFANLLKQPGLTGEQQEKYIDLINRSGNRMLSLISDIIDISRIESGNVKLVVSPGNLNELLDECFNFFMPEAEAKNVDLKLTKALTDKYAIIKTDHEKLEGVVMNLIKNAIKYTDAGIIEFGYHLTEDEAELIFFVKDTGIGIPENRKAAIFERFVQADIEDKMAREGAGLGLSIAKGFVKILEGKIWVESKEGEGSIFYFTIPYKHVNVTPKLPEDAISIEYKFNKKLKILIADDDDVSCQLLTNSVSDFASQVVSVNTGSEAVKACKANPDLDLVLMDIRMPGTNGYHATKKIREFNKNVVIIAQTAFAFTGDKKRSIVAGCNDYIPKPLNKEEIEQIILKYFLD